MVIKEYCLVYLVIYGEFLLGNCNNFFVVFSDCFLDLDEFVNVGLDKFIDLMVLLVCCIVVGDFDVELGFVGLVVKIGVKMAIGSLWYVSDEVIFVLMISFYD